MPVVDGGSDDGLQPIDLTVPDSVWMLLRLAKNRGFDVQESKVAEVVNADGEVIRLELRLTAVKPAAAVRNQGKQGKGVG